MGAQMEVRRKAATDRTKRENDWDADWVCACGGIWEDQMRVTCMSVVTR